MEKNKIVSEEPVEELATNEIPDEAEIVDGVENDAPEASAKLRVRVTTEFLDKTADLAHRRKGDIFEVDENRANELAVLGYAKIV